MFVRRDRDAARAFARGARIGVEREPHRANMLRRRAAAAADEIHARFRKTARVIAKIIGRRGIKNSAAVRLRKTRVRLRGKINYARTTRVVVNGMNDLFNDRQHARGSDGTIDANDVDFERRERVRDLDGRIAVLRHAVVGKSHLRDERNGRNGIRLYLLRGANRFGNFREIAERFKNERVGFFRNERGDLFAERGVRLLPRDRTDGRELYAERSDGGGDERVFARRVHRRAREFDARRVDCGDARRETVRFEFETIRAKRIGLDDFGARAQILGVQFLDERGLLQIQRVKALLERDAVRVQKRAGGAIAKQRRVREAGEKRVGHESRIGREECEM
ncbi:MAG: hypothetical protein HDKAJFGB_03898 [Anaerolineae bacterium]|nr:hypothetical protein [Anaerolineae bacterium]